MPKKDDNYIVTLKESYLKEWGTKRKNDTRNKIKNKSYIPIPKRYAKDYEIYNSNKDVNTTEYTCSFKDTSVKNIKLKASGSSSKGDLYAKQFQGYGNLKLLTDGYNKINAKVGDKIKITFTSPTNIEVEKMK